VQTIDQSERTKCPSRTRLEFKKKLTRRRSHRSRAMRSGGSGAAAILLIGASLAEVGAFRLTFGGHGPVMRSGGLYSTASPNQLPAAGIVAVGNTVTRRGFGQFCAFQAAALALRGSPKEVAAEFPRFSSLTQADIESWEELDDGTGLRVKEVSGGLGERAVKDGDKLRVRYSVYLQDGTVVSRGQVGSGAARAEQTAGKRDRDRDRETEKETESTCLMSRLLVE
jgi:hypothetical protein